MIAFRIISFLSIIALLVAIALDLRRRHGSWKSVEIHLRSVWHASVGMGKQRRSTGSRVPIVRRIVYLASLGLALVLAITAFTHVILLGKHVSGVMLVVHVTVAPFFAVALAVLALVWAHRLRLRVGDWHAAWRLAMGHVPETSLLVRFIVRGGFWFVLLCSLPLLLSIILSLYPLFGTEGQELLRQIHGYSALALILVTLLHTHIIMTYVESPIELFLKENSQ